ncbi:MAG: hypothetical protein IJY08_02985 [Clostridia bacterium]|nr:hypothetical protein [Clostridia bacterium]
MFGEYGSLVLRTAFTSVDTVLMQDLAEDTAYDVSDEVELRGNEIIIPGELISRIGTSAQPRAIPPNPEW